MFLFLPSLLCPSGTRLSWQRCPFLFNARCERDIPLPLENGFIDSFHPSLVNLVKLHRGFLYSLSYLIPLGISGIPAFLAGGTGRSSYLLQLELSRELHY